MMITTSFRSEAIATRSHSVHDGDQNEAQIDSNAGRHQEASQEKSDEKSTAFACEGRHKSEILASSGNQSLLLPPTSPKAGSSIRWRVTMFS